MNNKFVTYFLIAAFISVWLIIGFTVYKFIKKDEQSINHSNYSYKSNNQLDSFSLMLDYADPFTGKLYEINKEEDIIDNKPTTSSNKPIVADLKNNSKQELKPKPIQSTIQYLGAIDITTGKRRIAIVKINNVEQLIQEGELIEGVKLLNITNDFIMISRNGTKAEKIMK